MLRIGTLLTLLLVSLVTSTPRNAVAAVKEFPYEAVVEADEAFVRCGPGKNFYTTIKLSRGQHVTVRRHDPGGWFMIDPPQGSFSLIRMDDVLQEGNFATVKRLEQGQASVRIGSSIDPTADSIFQRKLSTGERVEILGEVIVPRKDRQVHMFRIRPPRGEFRWIEGTELAPLDPQIKQQQDSDPFSTPPRSHEVRREQNNQTPTASTGAPSANQPPTQPGPKSKSASPNRNGGPTQQVVIGPVAFDPRGRLDQIDGQFRDMIGKEPSAWNLAQIEQAYRQLRGQPTAAGIAGQIDLRFSALSHYKQVKTEYDDYFRLVSGTSRRDAELAAVENSLAPQNSRPPIGNPQQGNWQQGNWQQRPAPSETNYRPPVGPSATSPSDTSIGAPTLSMANPNAGGNSFSQQAPDNFTQPQNGPIQSGPVQSGPTLGVPVPIDNRPAATPSAPDTQSQQVPNGPTGPSNRSDEGNLKQEQTTPMAPVVTEPPHADSTTPAPPSRHHSTNPDQFAPQQNNFGQPYVGQQAPNQMAPNQVAPSQPAYAPPSSNSAGSSQGTTSTPQGSNPYENGGGSRGAAPSYTTSQSQPFGNPNAGTNPPTSMKAAEAAPQQNPGAANAQPFVLQPSSPPRSGAAVPQLAPPRQIRPQGSPPLDGAGIVQRAATSSPNGPRHVLLAPNGRILAYLQPEQGINLDGFIGRSMGIVGYRSYRPELQTDLIVVRGMMPVRLAQ